MKFPRALLAALLCVAAPVAVRPASASPAQQRHPVITRHPASPAAPLLDRAGYPHIANYNGLQHDWQAQFMTSDDLVVARLGAPIKSLLSVHPHANTLLYERSLQADLNLMPDLYGLNARDVPPGWWLTTAGSALSAPINAAQTAISVADPRPFKSCQDVLVDGESMHIRGIDGHTLYVARGYYSKAAAHRAGARIAPHYSYRKDLSNCGQDSLRPWSFNMSSLCPRWHGQRWVDFLARRVAALVRRDGWRGVFYDNLQDFPPSAQADTAETGYADGGIVDGVNVWRAGQRALLAETRRLLPGAPILVNGDLRIDGGLADGREMEAFPLIPGAALMAGIDAYEYDAQAGHGHTIVNPDTVTRPVPSLSSAQLAAGVSLLGDGYVAYDEGWITHGAPWWFDEYDGGRGSATTRLIQWWETTIPVVHPQRFRPGDTVLVDQEAMRVLRVLPHALVAQRGVDGTPADWHAARASVTTAAQRAAGHGYLGQPLGPARLVPTDHWSNHPLPLWLQRGAAKVDGRAQRAPLVSLKPATTLRISSTLHYYATVSRMTLVAPPAKKASRTLVFAARGPAGNALWLNTGDGHTTVPLVLRSAWHTYAIPVGGVKRFVLGVARSGGVVEVKNMRLVDEQAFVLRRDFTHGIVLVNPTDQTQRVHLERPYTMLKGDQNPWSNSGATERTVALAHYRAAILLK